MSPANRPAHPPVRTEEGPAGERAAAPRSEREQWSYRVAAYPVNRGLPHFVDFPGEAP